MTEQPRETATPELGRTSRGPAVRALRASLRATSHDPTLDAVLDPDGGPAAEIFDDAVDEAVRAFQQGRGLVVDGVVGPSTHTALEAARWHLGDRLLRFVPGHLERGDDVAELQQRLLGLGFALGRVDGILGADTDQAVRAFQRGCGLSPDGSVGPQTLRALDGLRRSVGGGAPNSLREREQVRRSGHNLAGRVVVLDPGHGGSDTGGAVGALAEADVVLDLARRIEGRLTAHGVSVLLTRTQSGVSGGSEEERAAFANDCSADLVISLHVDRSDHPAANGLATFFYGHDGYGARSAVGEELASLVQRETVARTALTDCRSHARAWPLLQLTRMPTVRLEAGYLSNPDDAARLAQPAFRDALAEGVVVAIQRMYLGEDDIASTGLLHLGDLRRYLESLAG